MAELVFPRKHLDMARLIEMLGRSGLRACPATIEMVRSSGPLCEADQAPDHASPDGEAYLLSIALAASPPKNSLWEWMRADKSQNIGVAGINSNLGVENNTKQDFLICRKL
jgi:hypothetical protein